jgi:hypothetical protein
MRATEWRKSLENLSHLAVLVLQLLKPRAFARGNVLSPRRGSDRFFEEQLDQLKRFIETVKPQ